MSEPITIRLPKSHIVVHENTLARLRSIIGVFHASGDLSDLDFEALEDAITCDERNTMNLMLAGGSL